MFTATTGLALIAESTTEQVEETTRPIKPRRRNPRSHELVVLAIYALQDACSACLGEHDEDCDCNFCTDVQALDYQARMFEVTLSSDMLIFPEMR